MYLKYQVSYSVDKMTRKSLLWCSFSRLNRCLSAFLISTRGGSKTPLFSITGGPLFIIFSTFPPLTPLPTQHKVATNHHGPRTPKSLLEKPRPRPGLFPPQRLERKLLYGLAAGKGCLGSPRTAGIFEGPPKRGPYLLQCSRSGSMEQGWGGGGEEG